METDEKRATEYYLLAAEQDYPPAQTSLAVCYLTASAWRRIWAAAAWLESRGPDFPGR